ncbi:MAG: class IV adenylate cyclase [Thermoanaerobaculaceae bacterium]
MVEQEMKIPVTDLTSARERLRERGWRRLAPLTLEDNWVLDDDGGTLRNSGRLLRVRQAGRNGWLTLKEPGSFHGGVKSRVEIESPVESAERVLVILAGLGFRPVRRYQKRREEWALDEMVVALDETPVGSFVEVEGPGDRLAAAAVDLGLDPRSAVRGTYLDLWTEYRALHPTAPTDMVFSE